MFGEMPDMRVSERAQACTPEYCKQAPVPVLNEKAWQEKLSSHDCMHAAKLASATFRAAQLLVLADGAIWQARSYRQLHDAWIWRVVAVKSPQF